MSIDAIAHRLSGLTGLDWVAVICVFMFAWVILQAHFNNDSPVDLYDMLLDDVHGRRRITLSKFTAFATTFVVIWAFLYSLTNDRLGDDGTSIVWFALAGWGYRTADKMFQPDKNDPPQGGGGGKPPCDDDGPFRYASGRGAVNGKIPAGEPTGRVTQ